MTKKNTQPNGYLPSVLKEKLKLLVVAAAFVAGGAQAQVVTTITTPGGGQFTVPANVATMTVECWGGGGAGGSAENGATAAQTRASGGAGGTYSKKTITNPASGNYNYVVGAGGIPSGSPLTNLSYAPSGGLTSFSNPSMEIVALAKGGNGGQNLLPTTATSGLAILGETSDNIGDVDNVFFGGGAAASGSGGSSGGGASGGATGVGASGTIMNGGLPFLNGGGGAGGNGTNSNGTYATAGTAPGGAGGGGTVRAVANTYRSGGAGANGQIKISYTLATASSTVEITAPTNKTVVAIGGSVELSATITLYSGKTFSSIVFKDGTETISGTISNVGDVYSITYSNVPSGKRNITAELTDNTETVVSPISIIYGGPVTFTGNKYAQSAITWNAGPWYDDATDGQVVTAPTADDNVFSQGYAITITDDVACNNLTFTNAVDQIGIAANKTLTVRGTVDCSAVGTFNAFGSSDATSTLKFTGETLSTPFILVTENATSGMKPNKVIIEPTTLTNTYQWGTSTGVYTHGANAFIVAAGTQLTFKNSMYLGDGVNNHFQVGAGAIITMEKQVRGPANLFSRITKATIDGALIAKDNFVVKELTLGTNGKITTWKSTNSSSEVLTFDGWWGNGNFTAGSGLVSSFGTPTVLTYGSNSTIDFALAGNQNVNGIIPANSSSPTTAFPIPYANLTLSGSGVKTIQSNLSFSGAMNVASGVTTTVASGVTLTIPSGATLTIPSGATLNVSAGAKVTNNGTITNEGTINYLSDATNGTATYLGSGTISGAGTVNVNQSLQHPAGALRTWYVASPVASFDPAGMSTIKYFDETLNNALPADNWTSTTTMIAKKGYVVTPANAANNLLFTGALNDGEQNITLTSRTGTDNKAGFNLIGNPYLSYLDWNAVAAANTGDMRSTTLWYRTKNGSSYNFWTVNGDGVGVPNGASALIPPMQAFWVRAVEGGSTLNLTNAMRAHAPSSDKLLKAPAVNNRTLVRLQVSNGVNTDEAVIYFSENAQNGFDSYDAPKMSNENVEIPEIYTTLGAERIVINSMNSIPTNSAIGLGFVAGNASSFSLKAYEVRNIPEGVKVMLRDNVTLAETDLTDGTASYGFTPQTSSGDRFSLIFRTAGNSTGVQNVNKSAIKAYVNAYKQLVISATKNSNYAIYNALGQQIENGILKADLQTINCKLQTGLYVVKVNNQSIRVVAP